MLSPDLNEVRVQRLTRFLDVIRGPERSEGPAPAVGSIVKREPECSEGSSLNSSISQSHVHDLPQTGHPNPDMICKTCVFQKFVLLRRDMLTVQSTHNLRPYVRARNTLGTLLTRPRQLFKLMIRILQDRDLSFSLSISIRSFTLSSI